MQPTPQRRNRLLDGPRSVKRSVSFPADIAEALDRERDADPRHNFSILVVEAVIDWLNRENDVRAA